MIFPPPRAFASFLLGAFLIRLEKLRRAEHPMYCCSSITNFIYAVPPPSPPSASFVRLLNINVIYLLVVCSIEQNLAGWTFQADFRGAELILNHWNETKFLSLGLYGFTWRTNERHAQWPGANEESVRSYWWPEDEHKWWSHRTFVRNVS